MLKRFFAFFIAFLLIISIACPLAADTIADSSFDGPKNGSATDLYKDVSNNTLDNNPGTAAFNSFSGEPEARLFKLRRDVSRTVDEDFSSIRVLITTGKVSSIRLELFGAYYILENMLPLVGTKTSPLSVTITADGTSVAAASGSSQLYSGETITICRVETASSAGYIQLYTSGNSSNNKRCYLGSMIISSNSDKSVRLINDVPTAHYLYGIVPYEMSEIWDIEALKAQAIASKSYAFGFTLPGPDYDITDSFTYQGYRGYTPGYGKCMSACVDSCGKLLSYNGEILLTFYGATNGGETDLPSNVFGSSNIDHVYEIKLDNPDFEYAESKRQTLEIVYGQAPSNDAFKKLLVDEAQKIVGSSLSIVSISSATLHTPQNEGSQRNMSKLKVEMTVKKNSDGQTQNVTVDFNASKLKSYGVFDANYLIYWGQSTLKGYEIYFVRWGHGLGLSQWGAQARAESGCTYDEILNFYFRKFDITSVAERNPELPNSYTIKPLAYGVIDATDLNLRVGPGIHYQAIGNFPRNYPVVIVGERDGWLICIIDGLLGYVRGDYIDIVMFPSPENAQAHIAEGLSTGWTSLYSAPSQYSDRIGSFSKNSKVYIYGEIGNWYYVDTPCGLGYARKSTIAAKLWFDIDLSRLLSLKIDPNVRLHP